MLMMFYMFGIVLTQGARESLNDSNSWHQQDTRLLTLYYGSLDRSILSLYEGMSGGISWGELYDPLERCATFYKFVFLTYISFAIFAVVNVVTGVFVESAMQASQQDKEALIQEELRTKEKYMRHVHSIFDSIASQNGDDERLVDFEGFEEAIQDERLVAFFNALELDISDVHTLFVLLDRDQTGNVNVDEFLVGCMRLKGQAKSLDLAKLQYEVEFVIHQVNNLSSMMRDLPEWLLDWGRENHEAASDQLGSRSVTNTAATTTLAI
jgi:hypothetical protein